MGQHYFIGIKIPEATAKALDKARNEWQLTGHKRYTPPVDMHITLLFIGNDPNGEIEQAAEALQNVKQAPFELTISGIDTFGNPATPRTIYAAVEESRPLNELQKQIQQAMAQFSLNPDIKAFVPHITLAGKWTGGPPMKQNLELEPMSFQVTEFSLFEIHPQETPRYIPKATYQLTKSV